MAFEKIFSKKVISGDPVASRLPYGIITRLIEIIGWKRLELNKLVRFAGVSKASIDSILRRTWVCVFKARFLTPAQLSGETDPRSKGLFLKDPGLNEFVKSGVVVPAMWRILQGAMSKHNKKLPWISLIIMRLGEMGA